MTLEQLRYFAAAVEEGTISGAARRLHVSQPPVSLQIRNLEAECGVRLFERGARRLMLTEAGKLLYRHAEGILEMVETAGRDMRDVRAGRRGGLRLGVVSSGTCGEFIRGVERFRRARPEVRFQIRDGDTYALLDALEKRRIELAVVRTPFPPEGLDSVLLRTDGIVAAGRPELLPGPAGAAVSLRELAELPLVVYRRWERILREAFEAEALRPDFFCVNDDARTSLQWASAGLGVALVPASALPLAPELTDRPLSGEGLTSGVCLVRRSGTALSESAAAFYETFEALYRAR